MVNFKLLLLAVVVVAADGQSPIHDNHKASVTAAAGVLGWYPWQGQWLSSNCLPGQTFTTSAPFANCQKENALPTACSSNTILYNNGKKSDCDLDRCETATLYESTGGQASTLVQCYATAAFRPEPRTFYRNTFALTATSTQSGASSTQTGVSSTKIPSQTDVSSTQIPSGTGSVSSTSRPLQTGSSTGTPGTQPTTSAAATPTLALTGGTVFWAGLVTVFMMGLGARMVI